VTHPYPSSSVTVTARVTALYSGHMGRVGKSMQVASRQASKQASKKEREGRGERGRKKAKDNSKHRTVWNKEGEQDLLPHLA